MREIGAEQQPTETLPTVDTDVLDAMHNNHIFDSSDDATLLRQTVADDQDFAHAILREGYERSAGDAGLQYAFIEGAHFAREALRRSLELRKTSSVVDDDALDQLLADAQPGDQSETGRARG